MTGSATRRCAAATIPKGAERGTLFLKSLTLKGFKSFAERTTLEFEPGVAVVVGPNGSGKSNLVDAVAWVLGAQGARAMRGVKMDDVIFAGTPKRAALGRAEVSLTIDNSAGLLPIEFTDVTITRTLFRSGESEYQLNGSPCRLLDVQELLSDTGVGRRQHVIVGQGQLDSVLNARPEDRRLIIEEAAGILKYRKRKEKAERRLEATEGSVLRLQDLLREVRRQLKPLERQADAARRHDDVASERRAIRLHLAGRELASLQARSVAGVVRRSELATRESAIRERLRTLDARVIEVEGQLTVMGADDLGDSLVRAESLRQRARGLATLLAEKRRGLARHGAVPSQLSLAIDADGNGEALATALDAAEADREVAERQLAEVTESLREAEVEFRRWQVRKDALSLALEAGRSASGTERLDGLQGVMGPLFDLVDIQQGFEAAVAAVLGPAMHAVVVSSEESGRAAVGRLRGSDTAATLLVAGAVAESAVVAAPGGSKLLASYVRCSEDGLGVALARLLTGVVVIEGDWQAALDLAIAHPELTVVTREGDCFKQGSLWRTGGAAVGATAAAFDEAMSELANAEGTMLMAEALMAEATAACAAAREVEAERRRVLDATLLLRAARYAALAGVLDDRIADIDRLAQSLQEQRSDRTQATRVAAQGLDSVRVERSAADRELQETMELVTRAEIEEAELRVRLEGAVEAIRLEFDREPQVALDALAPEMPTGSTLEERVRELDRELRLMGTINPLATEEYDALQARHTFLEEQLEDVRTTRRDLSKVIRAVDAEIASVFGAAYADVEEHFSQLFATLFPGGSGRLRLTNPDDLLNTGIEVEARPSGKSPRRLSLLSGGERSLAALAFLFAVFRSRPSPFYLLDEVEAALDDVNLHRFLDLVNEFRDEAQLLIVTHQKRTMEAADCLYGVSMPPGGSSMVVTERVAGVNSQTGALLIP